MTRTNVTARTSFTMRARNDQRFSNLVEKVASGRVSKTRKRRKINRTGWEKPKKALMKRGFDAFNVKQTTVTPGGRKVVLTEVVAPETGIHSQAWAEHIVPQAGFLALPIEIRHRIYDDLLDEAVILNPRKKGIKYITTDKNSTTIQIYNILTQLCRQTYVDVVGGSLLYAFARFAFSSPATMTRYLSCINPAHKSAVRKINLHVSLTKSSPAIPAATFTTLSSLPNLHSLRFNFSIARDMTVIKYNNGFPITIAKYREVRSIIIKKMAELHQWSGIKGLGDFEMAFHPTPRPSPMMPRYNANSMNAWAATFDERDPKLLELEKDIKKVVTGKE